MGLMQRACETYDALAPKYAGVYDSELKEVLAPVSHIVTNADIVITIDKKGRYTNLEMYLHYLVKDIVAAQNADGTYQKL